MSAPRLPYECDRCGLILGRPGAHHACSNALTVGLLLRGLRDACGKSQRDVAEAMKVSHVTVGHWERGRSVPGPSEAASFVRACGVEA